MSEVSRIAGVPIREDRRRGNRIFLHTCLVSMKIHLGSFLMQARILPKRMESAIRGFRGLDVFPVHAELPSSA